MRRMNRKLQGVPPLRQDAVRRILLVKPDHLGDMLLAFPAMWKIRSRFPGARIAILGDPAFHSFAVSQGLADCVIPFVSPWIEKGRPSNLLKAISVLRTLRREKFDLAINLRLDFREILLTSLSGAASTLSYDYRWSGALLTHRIPHPEKQMHEADLWLSLLESAGITSDSGLPPIRVPEADPLVPLESGRVRKTVVLHTGAGTPAKSWIAGRFAELAGRLMENGGIRIVVVGDHNAEAVAPGKDVLDLRGRQDLSRLAGVISRADAFVGADSGPAHLAGLLGVPAVVLFSGTNLSERWRPIGDNVRVLESRVDCRPCHRRECNLEGRPCMAGITVEHVLDSLRPLLENPATTHRSRS